MALDSAGLENVNLFFFRLAGMSTEVTSLLPCLPIDAKLGNSDKEIVNNISSSMFDLTNL